MNIIPNYNNNICFLLLITIILFSTIKNELRIPFKTEKYMNIPLEISSEDDLSNYLLNIIYKNIYIELEIGEPTPQKIKSYLKLDEFPFFIQGKDIPSTQYDQTKSTTYKSELYPHVFLDGEEEIKWGFVSNDTIKIENKSSNLNIKEFNFILVTETRTQSPSNIGLMIPGQYSSIPEISFIHQLKNQELIEYYSFVLNYTSINKDEGEFIVGGAPHIYDYKYNIKYYNSEYGINKPKYMMYGLEFDLINYGNNQTNIGGSMQSKFLSDFGLIAGTKNYYELILEKFFNDYINKEICYIKEIKLNIEWREGEKYFEYIYCDKNKVDISQLQNIKFIHNRLNYTYEFNYKELFDEIDNYYIFKIIFQKTSNFYWIFGKIWLEKYLMVFDQDQKTIGYYYINEKEKVIIDNKKKNINVQLLIGLVFIVLILIGFTIWLIFYLKKDIRKKRINEINDDYEYKQDSFNKKNLINNELGFDK